MRATYHQPFAKPGDLYPYKIEEIGIGLEGAGKFNAFNVLSHTSLGNHDTYELAEAAVHAEVARVNTVADLADVNAELQS